MVYWPHLHGSTIWNPDDEFELNGPVLLSSIAGEHRLEVVCKWKRTINREHRPWKIIKAVQVNAAFVAAGGSEGSQIFFSLCEYKYLRFWAKNLSCSMRLHQLVLQFVQIGSSSIIGVRIHFFPLSHSYVNHS